MVTSKSRIEPRRFPKAFNGGCRSSCLRKATSFLAVRAASTEMRLSASRNQAGFWGQMEFGCGCRIP